MDRRLNWRVNNTEQTLLELNHGLLRSILDSSAASVEKLITSHVTFMKTVFLCFYTVPSLPNIIFEFQTFVTTSSPSLRNFIHKPLGYYGCS